MSDKPEVTEIKRKDVEDWGGHFFQVSCVNCEAICKSFAESRTDAIASFVSHGWRHVAGRVLCPECVAEITKQEGVGG